MIPLITVAPPTLTETSLPVEIKNSSLNVVVDSTNPVSITGSTTLEGDPDNPLPVRVENQITLPESYSITTSQTINTNVVNQLELPLEYPISNDYYGNILIPYKSCFYFYSTKDQTIGHYTISIKSPRYLDIDNFNQWYFTISNISLTNNYENKHFEIRITKGLNNIDYSGFSWQGNSTTFANYLQFFLNNTDKSIPISFKGVYSTDDEILSINIYKGELSTIDNINFQFYVNFYCRSKDLYQLDN